MDPNFERLTISGQKGGKGDPGDPFYEGGKPGKGDGKGISDRPAFHASGSTLGPGGGRARRGSIHIDSSPRRRRGHHDAPAKPSHVTLPPAHLGNPLADLLRAVDFACMAHRDQRRKDRHTAPYINHPVGVAWNLAKHGVTDPATLQAAILHDTIEDTDVSYEDLVSEFGRTVADTVQDLSDNKQLTRQERKAAELSKTKTLPPRSKLVKLADKLYNVCDLIEPGAPASWTGDRAQAYVGWAGEVMRSCSGVCESLDNYCEGVISGKHGMLTLHDGTKIPMMNPNYVPGDWVKNTPNVDPAAFDQYLSRKESKDQPPAQQQAVPAASPNRQTSPVVTSFHHSRTATSGSLSIASTQRNAPRPGAYPKSPEGGRGKGGKGSGTM